MKMLNCALIGLISLSVTACSAPPSKTDNAAAEPDTLYASIAPRLHPKKKTPLSKPTQFLFSHNQTTLSNEAMQKLNRIASSMLDNPYAIATVSGERGTAQAPLVIAYLEAQGIPANRFQKKSTASVDATSPSLVTIKLQRARA